MMFLSIFFEIFKVIKKTKKPINENMDKKLIENELDNIFNF